MTKIPVDCIDLRRAKHTEQIPVTSIELRGTNYEIGFQMGKAISEISEVKSRLIAPNNCIDENDEKQITSLFNSFCPGLNEELEGFADANKINKRQVIFYLNTYLKAGCSQIALLPDITECGHTLLARNYDFNHKTDDLVVSRTKVDGGRYAHIGTNVMQFGRGEGLNECGFAVSQSACGIPVGNFPGALKPVKSGLQFWSIVRTLLENCKNVEEALILLKDMPIACNINLLLADKSGCATLVEIYDNKQSIYKIDESTQQKFLCATNHRHISMDPEDSYAMNNSITRYNFVNKWFENRRIISIDDLKSLLLAKYPTGLKLSYFNHNFGTIKSIVFDLNSGKMDICWGGQFSNRWQSYSFDSEIPNGVNLQYIEIEEPIANFFDQQLYNEIR